VGSNNTFVFCGRRGFGVFIASVGLVCTTGTIYAQIDYLITLKSTSKPSVSRAVSGCVYVYKFPTFFRLLDGGTRTFYLTAFTEFDYADTAQWWF